MPKKEEVEELPELEQAEEPKKTSTDERYSLEEVPTQTAMVIRDNETNTAYSGEGIFLEILNKLNKIENAVA